MLLRRGRSGTGLLWSNPPRQWTQGFCRIRRPRQAFLLPGLWCHGDLREAWVALTARLAWFRHKHTWALHPLSPWEPSWALFSCSRAHPHFLRPPVFLEILSVSSRKCSVVPCSAVSGHCMINVTDLLFYPVCEGGGCVLSPWYYSQYLEHTVRTWLIGVARERL